MRLIVSSFLFLLSMAATQVNAATLWCNPDGSNTAPYDTKLKGATTMATALGAMSSEDTLIIADGDWSAVSGMAINSAVAYPPNGASSGSPTIIRAETDWGVKIPQLSIQSGAARDYVTFQGIVFYGLAGQSHGIGYSTYIRFLKCGFYTTSTTGNNSNFSMDHCSYSLVEDCVAWGGGRYLFQDLRGHHNIFRRCVGRMDYYCCTVAGCGGTEWHGQQSVFRGYGCHDSLWQNCIAIDNDQRDYYCQAQGEHGTFWIGDQENGDNNEINGCIVLGGYVSAYYVAGIDAGTDTMSITDSVAIGPIYQSADATNSGFLWIGNVAVTANNITTINVDLLGEQYTYTNGKVHAALTMLNSVAREVGNMALGTLDYMYYYSVGTGSFGANSTNADPLSNGMLYPIRVESSSNLFTASSTGGRVGAEITKQWGTTGTVHGESGYNSLSSSDLWPWSDEDTIKTLFSNTLESVDGARGFCTGTAMDDNPQTLTKYIWEYLGNQIPCDIYGTCDETAPAVTISQSDPTTIQSASTTLTGTATDAVGVSSCKWRPDSAPDGSNGTACSGSTSWSCAVTGMELGENTVYVGCTDAAGNWGSDSLTVTREAAAVTGRVSGCIVSGVISE